MSWKGTGRSGYGEQTILGDYDDFDGLSMNGRQWKNRLTKETRDLSGADYWHQRKALEPKMLEDIPTFVNGRPNIAAFAEPQQNTKKSRKKLSAFERICTAERAYDRLEKLSEELDNEYERGILEHTDYAYARRQLDEKMSRAWKRVEKLRGWEKEYETKSWHDFRYPEGIAPEEAKSKKQEAKKERNVVNVLITGNAVIDGLSDDNVFKKIGMIYYAIKKIVFNG